MRLRIAHSIVHRYDPPAPGVIQLLRLTPRNHEGQYVINWRIDVSADLRLDAHEDAFGNLAHVLTADGPFEELSLKVEGEVETQNTDGVVRGTLERFPPGMFLRDTPLTQADSNIRNFALDIRAGNKGDTLSELHALLHRLHESTIRESDHSGEPAPTAAEAFARKRGSTPDLAHIFLGATRSLQIPARYVAGYLCGESGTQQEHGHAWAEAFVPTLGWVGFDPVHCVSPTDAYVRVAVGVDALGAAPLRGSRYGIGGAKLAEAIRVDQ
jgi:transglutaminase-like putative cysteine protease